jgi:DNA-binding NarL/FixJ family response regulator
MMKQCDPDPDLQILPREVRDVLGLTDRQMQVALGMVRGEQGKQTAHRIGMGPRTIDVHRREIYNRLEAENGYEATTIVTSAIVRHWATVLIRTAIVFGRAFP